MGTRTAARLFTCLVLVSFASVGCKPMYGGKPERLRNADKKKKPPEPDKEDVKTVYVEECNADFRGDPRLARPQKALSERLQTEGETAMQSSDKAKDPTSQAELVKVAIDKFRNALIKDPYNAEATLALALAYDRVLRKGCALAMLKRLSDMEMNPIYRSPAKRAADRVTDNAGWFKGYRKDAIAAVGR